MGGSVGHKVIGGITDATKSLLRKNMFEIAEAYERLGTLGINIAVKLGAEGKNGVETTVQVSFVKEKITDGCKFSVDEKQRGLFDDPGVESVEFLSGGRSVTMTRENMGGIDD
jgi:hypothetical protein